MRVNDSRWHLKINTEQSLKCAYFMAEFYMYMRLALSTLSYLTVSKAMAERLLKLSCTLDPHLPFHESIITLCFFINLN